MKTNLLKGLFLLISTLFSLAVGTSIYGQQLVHYWNFNDNTSEATLLAPSSSLINGAGINHIQGGSSLIEIPGTGQGFDVENLNAQNGDLSETHLRFNNPIGGQLVFSLPTTGFEDVVINFATRRSAQGAGDQTWSYSTDGISYTTFSTIQPANGNPTLATLDFSAINGVNNNPNFKLKVEFSLGAGGTGGNNRFDNFTMHASPIATEALIHYWNFNDNTSQTTLLTPSFSVVSGAIISHIQGGASLIEIPGTGQGFDVDNLNARNGDLAETHLRFNAPIGGTLIFDVPTTGFEEITVKFATRRSGSGAGNQLWSYSLDGTNFITFTTINPVDGNPSLQTLDFTSIIGINDNANFKLKVEFEAGSAGTGGNNRFDNFTVDGYPIGGGDAFAPVVSFSPSNLSTNVSIGVNPIISFNEAIRLINDDAINATNILSAINLKLNDENGANVPFTVSVNANDIQIIPSSTLLNNQQYYLEVIENTIEDLSDNPIDATQSIQFTTISQQTSFNTGDLLFVAYRMNATATEDEIALLSLVDILPGTIINFTDSKFTSNAQAQCAGGIQWTAGQNSCITAGSIITIQTSAMLSNSGDVTGAGFGLSSGGDQVIVYTGSATNPNYITALTSIDWLTDNTTCGGSLSMIPTGLTDGLTSVNLSTAEGNESGNSVNAYYNGTQVGTPTQLTTSILDPQNWVVSGSGTSPQEWPVYGFPGAPTVSTSTVLNTTTIEVIFNADLDETSATTLSNYTGISDLASATMTNNGAANDTVTLTYSTPFSGGTNYTLIISGVENASQIAMNCPYNFDFNFNTQVSFASNFMVVNEEDGTFDITFNVDYPTVSSVDLVVQGIGSTAGINDLALSNQTINFSGTTTTHTISVTINDDNDFEQKSEYLFISLRNPVNCEIMGDTLFSLYIIDDENNGPIAQNKLSLNYIGSVDPSGNQTSTCEVVSYDPETKRLFSTSAIAGFLDILDFSNPTNVTSISQIDMNPYGGVTSVAVKNGIVAVASPNENEELDGSVVFFDTDGVYISQVTVGALPDMIVFTPDGSKVLTANEGQPTIDYSLDPEGSISIIDISVGIENVTQANVTTLLFTNFNAQESSLIASGVRKTKLTSTLSQDIEPEYITIDPASQKAWVSLQENNAMAEINLQNLTISNVWALGTKDYSLPGNGFDASDNNGEILIANWPVKGFYMPDAVANYSVGGVNYLISANEGDEKEYGSFVERVAVGSNDYTLNESNFSNANFLKKSENLGRFRASNLNGSVNNDGIYEEIYAVGSRSFSIWNASSQSMVYDSGDDFEMITSSSNEFGGLFNSDHEDNSFKSRSRAKGPEPEGVAVATLSDRTYAFVSLERIGGVMVYDVTNPIAPEFDSYVNNRSVTAYDGDHGPETMVFITAENSPTENSYLIVANEISGTLTIYEVEDNTIGLNELANKPATFNVFPNPSSKDLVYFNRMADVTVVDLLGNSVFEGKNQLTLDITNYTQGMYLIHTSDGATSRLVVTK